MNEDRLGEALQWCRDRKAGLPRPIPIFPPAASFLVPAPAPAKRSGKRHSKGKRYVYLLRAGHFHKIGVASNVGHRLDMLQCGCPYTLEVHHVWPSKQPYALEAALHWRLRDYRVRGEWFKLPSPVVKQLLASDDIAAFLSSQ